MDDHLTVLGCTCGHAAARTTVQSYCTHTLYVVSGFSRTPQVRLKADTTYGVDYGTTMTWDFAHG